MAILAWTMMGLALWHFTIWLPDRFYGGIVGAFLGALVGAVVIGLVLNGFSVPSRADTHLLTAIEGVPGALLGMLAVYGAGLGRARREAPEGGLPA